MMFKRTFTLSTGLALLLAGAVSTASEGGRYLPEDAPPAGKSSLTVEGFQQDGTGTLLSLDQRGDGDAGSLHGQIRTKTHTHGEGLYQRVRLGSGFSVRPEPRFRWTLLEFGLIADGYTDTALTATSNGGYLASDAEHWWGLWGLRGRVQHNLVSEHSGTDFQLQGLFNVPRLEPLQLTVRFESVGSMLEQTNVTGAGVRISW